MARGLDRTGTVAPCLLRSVSQPIHHFRVVSLCSPMHVPSIARTILPGIVSLQVQPPASVSCAESLGGMGMVSNVENGDVRMLKFQALFSYRKRSVSNGKQFLFIQPEVSFIVDRPFVFARHA